MSRTDCKTHPDSEWDEHYECDDCRDDQEKAIKAAREALEKISRAGCALGGYEGHDRAQCGICTNRERAIEGLKLIKRLGGE